ncbi:MAG: hypothetical protein IJR47_04150, partial [Clostridia bacterium]|nr:hypothetical protein [Clostridia bacterium]
KLTAIDIQRLKDELNKYEPTTREASYYEPTGFAEFTNAYNTGRTLANSDTTTTTQVRNAITGIKDTYDNLKLTLKNVEITRTDDNSEAIITIDGYNKPDAKIPAGSTASVAEGTQSKTNSATVDSAGKMTIRIAKATLGGNYNLGTKLTVVVNDTEKGESAPAEVTLPKRTNFITGDVNCGDLGTIAWGKQFEDVNIKNIPITYDLKTGDETNAKTDGKVVSWELDDDPQWTVDEDDNYIGEQTWTTIGVKHLKGVIATTADYQQPTEITDLKYAYATVEIIDKTELNNLVNAVSGYKEADFTKETWPAFNLARNAATNVNNSKDARQADISKALTDLQTARGNLQSQPIIQLSAASANLRINDIFEPLTYVRQAKTFDKDIGEKGEYDTELILSTVRVTELNDDETIIIYEDGVLKTPLDTSKAGNHDLTFTVTNTDGVSASAKLAVRVFGQGSNSPSSSDSGGGENGNVVPGQNKFTNGDVTIEFIGTDLFPEEEINKGIKFILEVTKITDDTNVKAVLDKLKSVLKGEVTIDGMYEIKIYKEVNGEKIRIKDSEIKVPLDVYLPISDAAIASNDYACIHLLNNSGYELIKGAVTELEGNKKLKIKAKSFSEYDIGYGGGISQVADAMNTDDTNNTNNNNNNNGGSGTNGVNDNNNGGSGANANGGQGGGDAAQNGGGSGGVAQGGGDGYVGLIRTGDNGIIFAVAITAGVSLIAVIAIMLQKRKQKNK